MSILKRLKDNVMGTDEQNKAAQKRMDEAKKEKDREQTKKMRPPTEGNILGIDTLRGQNRLAKKIEDKNIGEPKDFAELAEKSMSKDLRKTADRTFKSLPEEVKDYIAYQDAGFKKGGTVKSSASKRADGCAVKGKTRGRIV